MSTVPTSYAADPLLVDTVERLLADICTPEEIEHAEQSGWSEPTWSALAEAGFPWVGIPESAGGSGGTLPDLAAILRAGGRFAASVPLAETAMLGGWCLARAGLPIPPGPVSIVEGATVADGQLHIDGLAAWGRWAERIVAVDGTRVFSLRPDQVTITFGANLAGEARDRVHGRVDLADIEQADGPVGMPHVVERGALSRVIMASGALTAMAQMTIDYTNARRQFGKPVATFQAVQLHLVTAAQCAVRAQMAADVAVRALDRGDASFEIAAARVVADDAITLGTRAAHQAHGAMGVTREYPLQQLTRRLWSWRHEWGTTTTWRRRLGTLVAEHGADHLFELMTD